MINKNLFFASAKAPVSQLRKFFASPQDVHWTLASLVHARARRTSEATRVDEP